MVLRTITQPATEPVTLAEVEQQVRVGDLSEESNIINLLIQAVRERAEAITRRSLITQTQELVLNGFPSGRNPIVIPKAPLQSVVSIKYIDTAGVEQTLLSSTYRVISDSEPADIIPVYNLSWPVALNDKAVVRVRFICGYGPLASDDPEDPNKVMPNNVPAGIKQWMLLQIATLYESRESVVVDDRVSMVDLSTVADGLITNYRIARL